MSDYFESGFSVRQPMWHGKGTVLSDYPEDWADARVKAGLTWEPVARPAFAQAQIGVFDEVPEGGIVLPRRFALDSEHVAIMEPLKDHKLITRDDNERVLGVVGDGFELVSHAEMGEILEAILGQENVKFETAGSCRDGAQVWALCYLDEPYTVVGDDTLTVPYIALLNAHDGSGACKVVATQVRVVCANTYRAADLEGERTKRQFSFRHTAGVHDRIDEAKQALLGVRNETVEWTKLSEELFGLPVDDAAFKLFLQDFIPEPVEQVVSDRVRDNVDTARKTFKRLYLDNATTAAHRGTALGLVDASVEYLDHLRGYRNSDTLLGRTMLRPEPLKARAVKLAREVASR